MNYYKDAENNLYALDSAEFEHLLPSGCVQISHEEYQALTEPKPETEEQRRERIKSEIAAIEQADLMNRRAREAFILQAEQIAADQYGLTPEQLYAVNPGYKGAKDVDNEVKALRALL